MNFSRSTILVAAAALLAACGDKVTVTQYTPPATVAKVYGVEVAPATATVNTGASLTFTAAVNADAGVATTVTWSASAGTITSAGVFTAPATANPGIAVCATSTVDTGKKGCATVVVQAPPAVVPATVSINSITTTGNLNGTVNPAAVAGGIDVTLNVNPGNQTPSKIVLIVGGIRQDSQTFTAAQAAAMRYAADEAIANQSTFPQIVFSVNTAAFNATTGAPRWLNGTQGVSAQLYTTQGGSATAATATAQTNLTFANVDGFAITTSGGTSAVDGTGYRWTGNGSLTVNALPVMYSGSSIGTVNAALSANPATGSTCAAAVGAVGSATTKTGNVYVITGTLAGLQSPAGCTTTFPNVVTITATNAAGDNLTLAGTATTPAGVIGSQTGLRWDNVAPPTAGLIAALAVNGRASNWINDAVSFNTVTSGTNPNGAIAAAVVDAGIGGAISYNVRVGTTYTAAKTAAPLANATTLAASATNAAYCAVVYTADLLGNTQSGSPGGTCAAPAAATGYALPVAGVASVPFGVDRAAPTIAFSGGLASNAKVGVPALAMGTEFQVTVADTGLVGNSGMNSTASVLGTVKIYNTAAASPTCFIGVGTSCANAVINAAPTFPLVPTTTVAASATAGYYVYVAAAQDAAGNLSGTVTRTALFDGTAPALSAANVSLAANFYNGGVSQTITAFANDNLDVFKTNFAINYGDGIGTDTTFDYGSTTYNAFGTLTGFNNTNYVVNYTVPFFYRSLNGVTANSAMAVAANGKPSAVLAQLWDQVNTAANSSGIVSTAIPAGSVVTGVAAFPGAGAQLMDSWAITTAAANAWDGAGTNVAANPASRTITAVAKGPTATFNAPYTRVDLWGQLASGRWTLIGTSTSPTMTDNGVPASGRAYSYTFTFTPGLAATWAANPVPLIAVGCTTNGDCLTSPTVTPITIVP